MLTARKQVREPCTVIVTGGLGMQVNMVVMLGFIGSHVTEVLLEMPYRVCICCTWMTCQVIIFDNESTGHNYNTDPNVVLVKGGMFSMPLCWLADIRDKNDLKKLAQAMHGREIAGLIHLAAAISVEESNRNPEKYYDNNMRGILLFLYITFR